MWEQGQDDKAGALFGGYAVAYVRDNELNFAGFRLYARDVEGEQTPLFWKSVFSRFVQNVDDKTELYFPYHVFMEGQISHDEATCEGINSFAKSAKGHHEYLDKIERQIFKQQEVDPLGLLQLFTVLSELSNRVDDRRGTPSLRGLCMLGPMPGSCPESQDAEDILSDFTLQGQNYGMIGRPIQGAVIFRRLKKTFLENVDPVRNSNGGGGR